MAGNFATVLLAEAARVLEKAGVPAEQCGEALAPLAVQSLRNAAHDPSGSLTGPAARGDHQTVDAHRLALAEFHDSGFVTVATVAREGASTIPAGGHVALLVGSEAHGLPAEAIRGAMRRLTIPTGGVESLNAAVAGSVRSWSPSRTPVADLSPPS